MNTGKNLLWILIVMGAASMILSRLVEKRRTREFAPFECGLLNQGPQRTIRRGNFVKMCNCTGLYKNCTEYEDVADETTTGSSVSTTTRVPTTPRARTTWVPPTFPTRTVPTTTDILPSPTTLVPTSDVPTDNPTTTSESVTMIPTARTPTTTETVEIP